MFVPIVKRPKIPFKCQLCRCDKIGACDHEMLARDVARARDLYDCVDVDPDDNSDPDASNQPTVEEDHDEEEKSGSSGGVLNDLDVWTYCPLHVSRPVLPCTGEHKITENMYKRIKGTPREKAVIF